MTLNDYFTRMCVHCTEADLTLFKKFLGKYRITAMFENSLHDRENMIMSTPLELVMNGFIWGNSPDGFEYWSEIDNMWREYYEKHNENKKTEV